MKKLQAIFVIMLLCSCLFASVNFRRGQWVYWTEVNQSGKTIVVVGKVLSKDYGAGTYRIESNDRWKMHLKKEVLSLVPKK